MKAAQALVIKLIVGLIAFSIGLDLFFVANLADVISFSVASAIISYIVADRLLLERVGSTNTLLVEFLLNYLLVWVFGAILLNDYLQIAWGSVIASTIITGAEVVVHRFLLKTESARQKHVRRQGATPKLRFVTEFAKDEDPTKK
ncbi:hypothetical protein A374_01269 [Fictibacillus macauensis ZFHKF-1]|uniref:Integral inner membrane protein n=1 Tax=Fictibacillus macauensis ZFHKF-1 TaxID=1196324 RepID=I8AN78_9BACL|nr:DUF2512 family protein [Fictibacillus macauensis]EIT87229.1 hypothetical protein A374_01269 [Fictibacillus macauensis ZFHKF-1]